MQDQDKTHSGASKAYYPIEVPCENNQVEFQVWNQCGLRHSTHDTFQEAVIEATRKNVELYFFGDHSNVAGVE